MKRRNCRLGIKSLMISMILSQGVSFNALAHGVEAHPGTGGSEIPEPPACQIVTADWLFDGINFP